MAASSLLFALAALPFLAALAIALLAPAARALHAGIAGAASAAGCALLLMLAGPALSGEVPSARLDWVPTLGLDLALMLDPLGLLFAGLILGIGLLVVIYAQAYLSAEAASARFFASLMLFQGAMLGIALAGNILFLLIFWELTSLSSFLLIGFASHSPAARAGARMALAITGGGGLALIAGLVLLGSAAGSFDLATILTRAEAVQASPLYPAILALILIGAFTKSAQFPFHFWLPHAMAAPTPVSAYLHSATMVKAGVFLLARLWPVLAGTEAYTFAVTLTGLATMLVGASVALFRHDLKAILAYSTISQLGMMVMLLGLSSELAVVAALLLLLNHAVFKAALFMAAGIVDHETGTRDIRQMGGLARAMPIAAAITAAAAAAMAGVPPLGGFIAKELMLEAALGGTLPGLPGLVAGLATLGALLSVGYSIRLILHTFFGRPRDAGVHARAHDPGPGLWASPALLALTAAALGLAPMLLAGPLIAAAAGAVTGGAPPALDLALWHGLTPALGLSLAALAGGAALFALHRVLLERWERLPHLDGKAMFDQSLAAADNAVQRLLAITHTPSLQRMLLMTFAVLLALIAEGALSLAAPLTGPRPLLPAPPVAVIAWGLLIAATIAVIVDTNQRLRALIFIGVIGIITALAFVHLSAPDLALTQIAVEVVTILLLLLALNLLPKRPKSASTRTIRARDAAIAALGGVMMAMLAWAILTREPNTPISAWHLANSYSGSGGTNVVNVILVDFRAFDTFGEIIVLGIAGLAIFALLDTAILGAAGERLRTWQQDMPHAAERHPTMLVIASRLLLPLGLMVAIYLFLRGHNQPGGGFVAALVAAIAVLLQYLAAGFDWTDARRRFDEHTMIAWGVLVALATGLGALAFGASFLASAFDYFTLPLVGTFEVTTAMLFDTGVFLTVFGAVMLTLEQLSHIAQRAARAASVSEGQQP